MARSLSVLCSSSVPPGIRGALTLWYLEVLPGIFVGSVTTRVREEVWEILSTALADEGIGFAVSVHAQPTEQGFVMRSVGDHPYQVEDFGGLQLIVRQHRTASAEVLEGLLSPPR